MSKLLLDEKPLMIMPTLATKIGLSESIFLQQVHYWIDRSNNLEDGHKWVYNSVKEWQVQFPFWSESTIRRIIIKLENNRLIITGNFNKLSIDQTKWYRINYEKLKEIENESIESRKRQTSSQIDQMDCSNRATGLPNLDRPLPEITTEITTDIYNNIDNARAQDEIIENPFMFFEKNGFGNLSPYVGQKVGAWISDLNEELVVHAMKISVANGATKWNYVESILKDWANKKFTSVSDVEAFDQKRKQQQQQQSYRGKGRYGSNREELAPEWLKKDKPHEERQRTPEEQAELEKQRDELLRELQSK